MYICINENINIIRKGFIGCRVQILPGVLGSYPLTFSMKKGLLIIKSASFTMKRGEEAQFGGSSFGV